MLVLPRQLIQPRLLMHPCLPIQPADPAGSTGELSVAILGVLVLVLVPLAFLPVAVVYSLDPICLLMVVLDLVVVVIR